MTNTLTYVEDCTAEELSVAGIRKRAEAFNETFARNGGYKGYEAQAVDMLLVEIGRLNGLIESEFFNRVTYKQKLLEVTHERDVLVEELAGLKKALEGIHEKSHEARDMAARALWPQRYV